MKAGESYCLPVTRQHDRFVAEHAVAVYDLPRLEVLRPYFRRHYVERPKELVEVAGVTYRTSVYEPRDVEDSFFAIVASSGVPHSSDAPFERLVALVRSYWQRVRSRVEFGDSLSAISRTYLVDEFIVPSFTSIDMRTGNPRGVLSWGELQQHARLVLLGAPGSGKTSCLRMLARAAITTDDPVANPRIPVYIALRELDANEVILARAARLLDLQPKSMAFADLLASGRAMLLLDGLDEVEDRGGDFVRQVFDLSRRYPQLGLVISTREASYHWQFPGFLHVRIPGFSKADRDEWIRRRIGSHSKRAADQFIGFLESSPDLEQTTSSPLTLLLVATAFESSGVTPRRTSDLVLRYVDALLEKWDAERGVRRWRHRPFEPEPTLRVLCRTAFRSTVENRFEFSPAAFGDWEEEWSDKVDPTHFLDYVWKSSYLLRPGSDAGSWGFQNSVVRDVLCAKFIVERTDDPWNSERLGERAGGFLNALRYACEISVDASSVVRAILRSDLALTKRAAFIGNVVVGDISVRESIQQEAFQFLGEALVVLSANLQLVPCEQPAEVTKIVIAAKDKTQSLLLKECMDIILPLVGRGTLARRRAIAEALGKKENWLIKGLLPAMASEMPARISLNDVDGTLVIEIDLP